MPTVTTAILRCTFEQFDLNHKVVPRIIQVSILALLSHCTLNILSLNREMLVEPKRQNCRLCRSLSIIVMFFNII